MTCCSDRGSDVISINIRALETIPRKLFPNFLQSLTSDCWKVFNSFSHEYSGKNLDRLDVKLSAWWLATEVWIRASWNFPPGDWLPKCGLELRESSEGKMAMISVGNYPQKRGKYHGRQWILFDLIGTKPYNNTLCITWPILGGELSVVA